MHGLKKPYCITRIWCKHSQELPYVTTPYSSWCTEQSSTIALDRCHKSSATI